MYAIIVIQRELFGKIEPFIDVPEAVIITGMRRVGKTTLLKYIFDRVNSNNKIFLDLENPINRKYFEENNFEKIMDAFRFLGLNPVQKGVVFLDEIQFVKNIPSVVKYLSDHHQLKFLMTGSASFYLKNLFSESLSGRKYIFELFPLSFKEFLAMKNVRIQIPENKSIITQAMFEKINRYYDEYVLYGGFPGVVQKESSQEKMMMIDDIFSSFFQLEVIQLGDFRKTNVIRDMMLLLMERTGSKLDIQKLSRELGAARTSIHEYISFLENTYFIKLVRPFSRNRDTEIRSIPKVYLCDSGMVNRFARVNEGILFENNIFSILRTKGEVNYYQKKSGVEIDFVLDKRYAFEVKIKPYVQDIKKLHSLTQQLHLEGYKIISRKYCELENVEYGFTI
jgi:hypothetical protein